jgi:hypothetical protein
VRRTAVGLGRLEGDPGLLTKDPRANIFRLARDACVLGVIGGACFLAAGAAAAPEPRLFKLTISVTSVADFDHTSAPIPRLDCQESVRAEGFRTATFRSRPTVVRFVGGRLQTVVFRGLRGAVKLSGTNTTTTVCNGRQTHTAESCPKTTRTFRDAQATLSGTASGSIAIRPPRVALGRIACPREPEDVVELPLGPAPGPVQLPVGALARRTTRVTLAASARRTKTYGPPEQGLVQQRTSWRFTLVRTGR